MEREKPLIVGNVNPWGMYDEQALMPQPRGSAGHLLCASVLQMYDHDYLRLFDRTSLCHGQWSMKVARRRANVLTHRPLILLGSAVQLAFGFDRGSCFWFDDRKFPILSIPFPAERDSWYKQFDNRQMVRDVVKSLFPSIAGKIGIRKAGPKKHKGGDA